IARDDHERRPGAPRPGQRPADKLRHAARRYANDDVFLAGTQPVDRPRAFLMVVLDPFFRADDRILPAGHDGEDELGAGPEGRRHLGRLEHPQAPAGAGADENDAAAAPERLRDDLDAARNPLFLALDGGEHLPVFVEHSLDNVSGRELVDGERRRVDCFGRKRLPLGLDSHHKKTSNKSRILSQSESCQSTVKSMVHAFLDHLRVERRLADHTIESYARDLAALARYAAGTHRPLEALDRRALETFVRQQMASGLSPRSVARSIAAVRGFYRFLVLEQRLEQNPADDLTPPRAWPALPKFLSIEQVDTLIAQPDVATPLGLRDRAMIELLYATGMRVSELIGVRPGDLHLRQQYVTC